MLTEELGITWPEIGLVIVAGLGVYTAVIVYTRVFGQRSLTSLATFDFAVTVAIGAIVGRVVLVRTSLVAGVIGLGVLFAAETAVSMLRNRLPWMARVLDNPPVLVFVDGEFLTAPLGRTHLSQDDLLEKVRLAGVSSMDAVRAVVFERNGGVSILTGDDLDPALLRNVRGAERLRTT